MKLLIRCYSENKIFFEEEFNHSSFYEVPFVQIGLKLDLIKVPEGYYSNNLQGLRLRRNFKATEVEKNTIINHSSLSNEERYILNIIQTKNCVINGINNIKDLISTISSIKLGNLEDISSWFEENNMKQIDKIEFIELED